MIVSVVWMLMGQKELTRQQSGPNQRPPSLVDSCQAPDDQSPVRSRDHR